MWIGGRWGGSRERETGVVAGDWHRDHVAVDHLADLDPGVVAFGHDVARRVAHVEVEPYVRMRRQEVGKQWTAAHQLGRAPAARKPRTSATATNTAIAFRSSGIVK
jgi:hypothetical protein